MKYIKNGKLVLDGTIRECDLQEKLNKALEIIIEKGMTWSIDWQPYEQDNDYRAWDNELYGSIKLTKEEYELLKEIIG